MKLTDLHPRFIILGGWNSPSIYRIGLTFDCPCCRTSRLAIFFHPAIDPDNIENDMIPFRVPANHQIWQRSGDTFDAMTLTPSIDTSAYGHWHGFIQNGEIR